MDIKIKNPLTGKLIYKNGVTHKKLIKDKVLDENGNLCEMDIDQIIAENRCWECKCELYSNSDDENEDEYKCEKCPEIYYSCKLCEDENGGHPVSADCETLCKGGFCNECKRRFCDHHWQRRTDNINNSSDESFDSDEEEISIYDPPLCLECFLKIKDAKKNSETFEMNIDQIIAGNRCWKCKCELESRGKTDEWRCEKCSSIYYSCKECEQENGGHPVSADCKTLFKGGYCGGCERHFCDHHWQCQYDDIDLDDIGSEDDLCLECYKENEFNNEDDKFYWQIQECKCWRCKKDDDYLVLKPTGEVDELECPKCQKIYYNCVLCEKDNKGNPVSQDVQINDKGEWCEECKRHFCIAHWQNMKKNGRLDEVIWYCEGCIPKLSKEIQEELSE